MNKWLMIVLVALGAAALAVVGLTCSGSRASTQASDQPAFPTWSPKVDDERVEPEATVLDVLRRSPAIRDAADLGPDRVAEAHQALGSVLAAYASGSTDEVIQQVPAVARTQVHQRLLDNEEDREWFERMLERFNATAAGWRVDPDEISVEPYTQDTAALTLRVVRAGQVTEPTMSVQMHQVGRVKEARVKVDIVLPVYFDLPDSESGVGRGLVIFSLMNIDEDWAVFRSLTIGLPDEQDPVFPPV